MRGTQLPLPSGAGIDFEDPNFECPYDRRLAYGRSIERSWRLSETLTGARIGG